MPTRRAVLRLAGLTGLTALGLAGYAGGIEPMRLTIRRYRPALPGWPAGLRLRIAVLADIHACDPWMTPARIAGIVARTNALKPDLTVLLGDYAGSHRLTRGLMPAADWAAPLGGLAAPLGVHAILGNHDWWDDDDAQRRGDGPVAGQIALEAVGISVLENRALPLALDGGRVWLAGLGDQLAFHPSRRHGRRHWRGRDDLPGTLAQVTDRAPVILLAHEPDIFPAVPARVALTLAGHTHGGQVRLFGTSPVVPSAHGGRYAYGHVTEPDRRGRPRQLIVSGGLGCSILPVRLGMPPEIVLVEPRAAA